MLEGRRSPNSHPNSHIFQISSSPIDVSADPDEETRTELDSHANMVVIGMHAYILNNTGRTTEVSPFTSSYETLKNVPIVDAIIAYDCLFSGKT